MNIDLEAQYIIMAQRRNRVTVNAMVVGSISPEKNISIGNENIKYRSTNKVKA